MEQVNENKGIEIDDEEMRVEDRQIMKTETKEEEEWKRNNEQIEK